MKKLFDQKTRTNLKKLFGVLSIYKKTWIISILLLIFITILKLPMPLLTGYIIDKVIIGKKLRLLNKISGLLIFLTVVYLFANFIKDKILFAAKKQVIIRFRLKLFSHIQNLKIVDVSAKETGYLLARILDDTSYLNGLFFQSFLNFSQSILTLLIGVTTIFLINWKLSIISLLILPFYVSSNFLFINRIKFWTNKIKEQNAIISKELIESLSAVKVIKLFYLFKREKQKLFNNLKKDFQFSIKEFNLDYIVSMASGFFSAMGPLLVIWFGGYEVIRGNLSIGQLVAFSALLGFLYNPTNTILNTHVDFQKSLVSLNRIYDILSISNEEDSDRIQQDYQTPDCYNIEFKDVYFNYNDPIKILQNINLKILNDQNIAIIGPIGSGKSTMAYLLARLYDPSQGVIYIGNIDIKNIKLSTLRNLLGFITQKDFLFSTSVYNNILIGKENATKEEVIQAARMANAYNFIMELKDGFDTLVGEGGDYLSGGQRQLICLARVILKNPPILIMDEWTSAVDLETEKLIQESLTKFIKGKVSIVISHRISSIINADTIIILNEGKIVDVGTPAELLKRNSFFNKIYTNQKEF